MQQSRARKDSQEDGAKIPEYSEKNSRRHHMQKGTDKSDQLTHDADTAPSLS